MQRRRRRSDEPGRHGEHGEAQRNGEKEDIYCISSVLLSMILQAKTRLYPIIHYAQELLGHNSLKTIVHYTHVSKQITSIQSPLDRLKSLRFPCFSFHTTAEWMQNEKQQKRNGKLLIFLPVQSM